MDEPKRSVGMIVNVGKRVRVDYGIPPGQYIFERDADKPFCVTVQHTEFPVRLALPGNRVEAERFIAAYRRCLDEDIAYRTSEVE